MADSRILSGHHPPTIGTPAAKNNREILEKSAFGSLVSTSLKALCLKVPTELEML